MKAAEGCQEALDMLKRIGADGMSSDETTDGEDEDKQSRVLVKDWRSLELTHWVRRFDRAPNDYERRGRRPRFRFYSAKVERNSRPQTGLPTNAYDSEWKNSMSPLEKRALAIDSKEFPFTLN